MRLLFLFLSPGPHHFAMISYRETHYIWLPDFFLDQTHYTFSYVSKPIVSELKKMLDVGVDVDTETRETGFLLPRK